MICPPCAKDQHEGCHVSHMGMLQAFCQCWCREVARDAEEDGPALLGVADFDYDHQAEQGQGPPA